VVNGHQSAAHTDSPDGGTGKACLGGGMHCRSASSTIFASLVYNVFVTVLMMQDCPQSRLPGIVFSILRVRLSPVKFHFDRCKRTRAGLHQLSLKLGPKCRLNLDLSAR